MEQAFEDGRIRVEGSKVIQLPSSACTSWTLCWLRRPWSITSNMQHTWPHRCRRIHRSRGAGACAILCTATSRRCWTPPSRRVLPERLCGLHPQHARCRTEQQGRPPRQPLMLCCLCWRQVLGMTDDVLAVSKPACMPVHVAGQHRKNTVCGRLQVPAARVRGRIICRPACASES